MFQILVALAVLSLFGGLVYSDSALIGVLFALLARLVQARDQHQELMAQLRGEEPPAKPDREQKWRDYQRAKYGSVPGEERTS